MDGVTRREISSAMSVGRVAMVWKEVTERATDTEGKAEKSWHRIWKKCAARKDAARRSAGMRCSVRAAKARTGGSTRGTSGGDGNSG